MIVLGFSADPQPVTAAFYNRSMFVTAVLRHSSESTFTLALSVTSRLLFDLKALILPPSHVHRHHPEHQCFHS